MSVPYVNKNSSDAAIIGAGLSGLLLANELADAGDKSIQLYGDSAPRSNHIWGYWDAGESYLDRPRQMAKGEWRKAKNHS